MTNTLKTIINGQEETWYSAAHLQHEIALAYEKGLKDGNATILKTNSETTVITNIGDKRVCFLKIPDSAYNFSMAYFQNRTDLKVEHIEDNLTSFYTLPTGKWKFINTLKNFTDQEFLDNFKHWSAAVFINQSEEVFKNLREELINIAHHVHVYIENPLGLKPNTNKKCGAIYDGCSYGKEHCDCLINSKWKSAENRTGNWAVLVEIEN